MKRSKGLKRGKPLKQKKGFKSRQPSGEKDFLLGILEDRGHVSWLSGRPVPHSVHSCAHILPKGHYKSRQFDPDNIVILHPEEHTLFDQKSAEARERYANWIEEEYGVSIDWEALFELYRYKKAEEEQKFD